MRANYFSFESRRFALSSRGGIDNLKSGSGTATCPFSIGAGCCQARSDFSIDPVLMSIAGSALLFGIGTGPSHDGIRRMGRNDLSHVVAVRLTARTRDRTDSPQPSSQITPSVFSDLISDRWDIGAGPLSGGFGGCASD